MITNLSAVRLEKTGEILHVVLNRPDRMNALNTQLVTELRETFQSLYFDRSVRVVVLRGEGRAFCAGLDLKESAGGSRTVLSAQTVLR
tara:strand:+ start:835 stop:1098 length:264 start_codon:yes stop_codon:yes gene_type:complete